MIGDTAEHIGEPCLRINADELGRFDQDLGNSSRLSSTLQTSDKPVLAPNGYVSHATFNDIVIDAEAAP
jgi:hypothetical protein